MAIQTLNVRVDEEIPRTEIANRLIRAEDEFKQTLDERDHTLIQTVGNIGAGKTTISRLLSRLGVAAFYELPEQKDSINNYGVEGLKVAAKEALNFYYSDLFNKDYNGTPIDTAYRIQTAYCRLRQAQMFTAQDIGVKSAHDGSFLSDAYAFAPVLNAMGKLSDERYREFKTTLKKDMHEGIRIHPDLELQKLPEISLIICVQSSTDYSIKNIEQRGRKEEVDKKGKIGDGMKNLIEKLNEKYLRYPDILRREEAYNGKMLLINAEEVDYVRNMGHYIHTIEAITGALSPNGLQNRLEIYSG